MTGTSIFETNSWSSVVRVSWNLYWPMRRLVTLVFKACGERISISVCFCCRLSLASNDQTTFVSGSTMLGVPSRTTSFDGQKTISRAVTTCALIGSEILRVSFLRFKHHSQLSYRLSPRFALSSPVHCWDYRLREVEMYNSQHEGSRPTDQMYQHSRNSSINPWPLRLLNVVLLRVSVLRVHLSSRSIDRSLADSMVQHVLEVKSTVEANEQLQENQLWPAVKQDSFVLEKDIPGLVFMLSNTSPLTSNHFHFHGIRR